MAPLPLRREKIAAWVKGRMGEREAGLLAILASERAALLRFLAARTGDPAAAEDLLQELWIKVRQAEHGPIANGRAYLFRIAQNLVLDGLRERRRREAREMAWSGQAAGAGAGAGEPADPAATAEEGLISRDEAERLARAIETLPEGARRVLRLHKIEGLSHAEVAERLGISRSGVEKHMAVAMAHLRKQLRD
jgi:RNA polymerase sigma factor (sigma-70 family)